MQMMETTIAATQVMARRAAGAEPLEHGVVEGLRATGGDVAGEHGECPCTGERERRADENEDAERCIDVVSVPRDEAQEVEDDVPDAAQVPASIWSRLRSVPAVSR